VCRRETEIKKTTSLLHTAMFPPICHQHVVDILSLQRFKKQVNSQKRPNNISWSGKRKNRERKPGNCSAHKTDFSPQIFCHLIFVEAKGVPLHFSHSPINTVKVLTYIQDSEDKRDSYTARKIISSFEKTLKLNGDKNLENSLHLL